MSRELVTTAVILALLVGRAHAFTLKPTLAEIGGGVFRPNDPAFKDFYNGHKASYNPDRDPVQQNDPMNLAAVERLTVGWFFYRVVSISFSGGYMYASGFGLEKTPGDDVPDVPVNSKRTRDFYTLSTFPFSADFRLNVDFLRNQWLIPYGTAGGSEILARWGRREDRKDHRWFRSQGWHYGGGVMVLLDVFDRYHADKMEDEWGIEDTYLTVDLRNTSMKGFKKDKTIDTEPHNFSGRTLLGSLTFRLKP